MGGVRFAPSPTGRFHVGNLRTAWISFRFARALGLPWVVRFEDIDEPRVVAGSRDAQLADMDLLGMTPDHSYDQSSKRARHLALFNLARASGVLYACNCSRRDVQSALAGSSSAPNDGASPVYSGYCRRYTHSDFTIAGVQAPKTSALGIAWRFRMPAPDGRHDFIVARTTSLVSDAGFVPAYHWACAIDDFDGHYDLIVRSVDLAPALPLQRAIQGWLSNLNAQPLSLIPTFHTSLVTQDDGHRLEKRTIGVTLDELFSKRGSAASVVSAFEKSFDRSWLSFERFDSSAVASEPRGTLKLSHLFPSTESCAKFSK